MFGLVIKHTDKEVTMTEASMKSINSLQTMVAAEKPIKGKRFIKVKEGVELYCMGKTKLLMEARNAGALIKIGRVCLIEVEVFEEYLESFRIPGEYR